METMVTSNDMQARCNQRMRCRLSVVVDKMPRDVESEIHVSMVSFLYSFIRHCFLWNGAIVPNIPYLPESNTHLHSEEKLPTHYNLIWYQAHVSGVDHSLPSDAASLPSRDGDRAHFREVCYAVIFVLDYELEQCSLSITFWDTYLISWTISTILKNICQCILCNGATSTCIKACTQEWPMWAYKKYNLSRVQVVNDNILKEIESCVNSGTTVATDVSS